MTVSSPVLLPKPQDSRRDRCTRIKKIAGKCIRQPIKTKLDFVSVRQAAMRVNKTDQPMFLCILRATESPKIKMKKKNVQR